MCFVYVTEEELEASFASKNFAHCDALQSTIRDIQAARSNLPLPDLTPTSRRELDLMLLEAKHTLDHAVTVHDLILAGKLELRIKHLEGLKNTLRTVEERKENLKAASAALSDAMDRKEFKKCAQLQQVRTAVPCCLPILSYMYDKTAVAVFLSLWDNNSVASAICINVSCCALYYVTNILHH